MSKGFTSQELDLQIAGGCSSPGCKHEDHGSLYLTQRCHPKRPTQTRYCSREKVIIVECAICLSEIIRVKVASL